MTDDRLHSRLWLRLLDQEMPSHQAAHKADQLVADRERHADEIAEILRHKGGEVTTETDDDLARIGRTFASDDTCYSCHHPHEPGDCPVVHVTRAMRGPDFTDRTCDLCHEQITCETGDYGPDKNGKIIFFHLDMACVPQETRWSFREENRMGGFRPVGPEGETY